MEENDRTHDLQTGATPVQPRRRSRWLLPGIVLAALLLAGAAFAAGRLLGAGGPAAGGLSFLNGGGQRRVEGRLDIVPSDELPEREPELDGIFVRRDDNSLFVGTGNVSIRMLMEGPPGSGTRPNLEASYDGPEVEVVVTGETTVYRDETLLGIEGFPTEAIPQVLKPGTLDELVEESTLKVWGKRSGDRIVAEVLVYTTPAIMMAPAQP